MKQSISLNWNEAMSFESTINGHKIIIDADESVGGKNKGPRPKPLLLLALAGCTAMDVVSMLGKMRVQPDSFHVDVEGELTEEHPKVYKNLHVKYIFTGKDLPMEKLEKAVNLSQERYCGVSAMMAKATELTFEIVVQ
ncbi:MAG: OsmC family protein [Bacteroidales bacterium]|nr:OsmC family protein [Bacteroidales bacterium]